MIPQVSIIIPCYNSASFIEETLESALNQSISDIEIIVVDDGSTDETVRIIESLSIDKLALHKQSNMGVATARNNGFKLASGKYTLFLDADDVLDPKFLENHLEYLEANTHLIGSGSSIQKIDGNSAAIDQGHLYSATELQDIVEFKSNMATCPSAYIFRTEALREQKMKFHESLSSTADKFFLLELLGNTKLGMAEDAVLKYRVHTTNMSGTITFKLYSDLLQFKNLVKQKHLIPTEYRSQYFARLNYTLAAYAKHLKKSIKVISHSLSGFFTSPSTMRKLIRS